MSDLKLDSFQILINGFHETIADYPPIEKVKDQLLELKDAAKNDSELTEHQRSAIVARCDNYLKNDYGEQRKGKDSRSDYQKKLN